MKKSFVMVAALAALAAGAAQADTKIGYVSQQRIIDMSAAGKAAQQSIAREFGPRQESLKREIADFQSKAQKFEKDAAAMSESERNKQRQQLGELQRNIAMKERSLAQEHSQRVQKEVRTISANAMKIIQDIAKKQKYDLIVSDPVVYVSPRSDLTDQVIKQLNASAGK